MNQPPTLHPSRSYKRSLRIFDIPSHVNTGRTYYQHQQIPNQTDPIKYPHRAHQTAIIRPRTQHAPLNAHLHRIMKEHQAKCVYCPNSDETVGHILISQFLLQNVVLRQNIFIETSTLPNWACHKIISRIICSCVIYQPWVKRHGWALSHRM